MIDYKKTFDEAHLSYRRVASICGLKDNGFIAAIVAGRRPFPKSRWDTIKAYLDNHNFKIYTK